MYEVRFYGETNYTVRIKKVWKFIKLLDGCNLAPFLFTQEIIMAWLTQDRIRLRGGLALRKALAAFSNSVTVFYHIYIPLCTDLTNLETQL